MLIFHKLKLSPLLIGLAFASSASILTTIFDVNERKDLNLKGIAIGTTLNIVLNVLFIPLYGTLGAAYAMLFSCITWFLVNLYFSQIFKFNLNGIFKSIFTSCIIATIYFYIWQYTFIFDVVGIIIFLFITYLSFQAFKKMINFSS